MKNTNISQLGLGEQIERLEVKERIDRKLMTIIYLLVFIGILLIINILTQ